MHAIYERRPVAVSEAFKCTKVADNLYETRPFRSGTCRTKSLCYLRDIPPFKLWDLSYTVLQGKHRFRISACLALAASRSVALSTDRQPVSMS